AQAAPLAHRPGGPTPTQAMSGPEQPGLADTRPAPAATSTSSSDLRRSAVFTTKAGALLGTPLYVPPECWRGEAATQASDLASLGAVLFELCSGRPPHDEREVSSLRTAVCEREAPPLETLTPEAGRGFAAIINRCLRRQPEERYQTAVDLLAALERLQDEEH